jgi:predicted nucleic acid-binding protein
MTTAVFVDSTTLLYAQDRRDPGKMARSAAWLTILLDTGRLALSLQVLNETYSVVKRKPEFAHWRPGVKPFLQDLFFWVTDPPTTDRLKDAWRLEERYQLSFWDSLLLASANQAGCGFFLSEDLNDGQSYGSVVAIDPFRHTPEDVLGAAARS